MASSSPAPAEATAALEVVGTSVFLDDWNDSPFWQERIFYALSALYGVVAAVALIQLIRIEFRIPWYGWTAQKVFHLLNFLVNGVRSVVFALRRDVQLVEPEIFQHVLLDMPGLVFFTTYTMLVLLWAEIYYRTRGMSTDELKPRFYVINGIVYTTQIILWLIMWWKPLQAVVVVSKIFFAGVSLCAASGFLLFGWRLFRMLNHFPVESRARRRKMQEVGYVASICFAAFLIRCIMVSINAFDAAADLDVLNHPLLDLFYYLMVEIIPSALVLFILRTLPPKRITQYQQIQ